MIDAPTTPRLSISRPGLPWRFLLGVSLAIALITTSVPIASWIVRPTGTTFTGFSYESVGDIYFYLNLIEQVAHGNVLLKNFMTPEIHGPTFLQPLFLFLGWTSRWLHLAPLVSWHLARVLLLFPFGIAIFAFLRRVFDDDLRAKIGLVTIAIGGGFYLINHEASTFLGLLYSPMSVLTLTLTILYLHTWMRLFRGGWSWTSAALLVALAVFQAMTHPYALVVWVVTPAAFLFLEVLLRHTTIKRATLFSLPVVAGALAGYGYLFLAILRSPVMQAWTNGAIIRPWWWTHIFLFAGAMLPLAILGVFVWRRTPTGMMWLRFLCVWLLSTLVLARSPYPYAGRLMMLLHLPLAILAANGVAFLWSWSEKRGMARRVVLVFVLALLVSENVRHLAKNFTGSYFLSSNRYVSAAEMRAFQWIRRQTPENAIILHAYNWDTMVAQLAYRQVYATGGGLTSNFPYRIYEALDIYAGHYSPEQLREFVGQYQIRYILLSARDRQSGYTEVERFGNVYYKERYAFHLLPEQYPFLREVYNNSGFQIYAVTDTETITNQ